MIHKKTQPISSYELILTAMFLTLLLIFFEKSWLTNFFPAPSIANTQVEEVE